MTNFYQGKEFKSITPLIIVNAIMHKLAFGQGIILRKESNSIVSGINTYK